MLAHLLADFSPDGQQDALTLVIAGPVGVRLAEIAGLDGPVHGAHDLTEVDVLRRPGQHVATADAPLRADQTGPFEGQQDLFEVGLGQPGALGDIAHRGRAAIACV